MSKNTIDDLEDSYVNEDYLYPSGELNPEEASISREIYIQHIEIMLAQFFSQYSSVYRY